ncbi:MAG: EI24 domain-containing protein [Dongiaceae bacterium]
MLSAVFKALSQLGDPPIRRVILRTLGLTLLSFVILLGLAWLLVGWLSGLQGWWGDAAQWGGVLATIVVAWFTFPALAATIASLFCDEVADAVEARYYPGQPPARPVPILASLADGLKLAGLSLLINLVALPFLFVPPLYAVISWGLGGYLLGREYFEMIAFRKVDRATAHQLLRQYRGRLTLAGILIAVVLTIPFVNLIAPVIATAFMVHLTESMVNQRAIRSV